MSTAEPLELHAVTKRWPGRSDAVLDAVDVRFERGSLTWLGGENGAGKTTLLRIACGLLAPTEGAVSIEGLDLERDPRACKRRLGFLSAGSSGLYARLTVAQQLDYWARIAFVPRVRRRESVAAAVEAFGLGALTRARQDRISMGERQRVRLAMTFLHGPSVVLLDEPRTSLDERGLDLVVTATQRTRDEGGAVVWCSPTNEPPAAPADRHLRIRGGRVEAA